MDKDKEILTAEEYINGRFEEEYGTNLIDLLDEIQNPDGNTYSTTELKEFILIFSHEYAVLFARYHRLQAIEAIVKNELINGNMKKEEESNFKFSIENAYKEEEIK